NGACGDPTPTGFDRLINEAVFPGLQGGPHNNSIAALAVALNEAASPEFKEYQKEVISNMQQLCSSLISYGYTISTICGDPNSLTITAAVSH
ncbi:hypothetical protein X801_08446, partial [Opisthorchis viverrini]